jgi:hypothetical protein
MVKMVISGGQTGVDRAGLDAAMEAGIPVSGSCPKGRKAEDGPIPDTYPMTELDSPIYQVRTEQNVIDSDGTLIINKGPLTTGTKLTRKYARQHGKPCLVVKFDARKPKKPVEVIRWLAENRIKVLNIAGPRESKFPGGIYQEAFLFLEKIFKMKLF